MPDKKATTMYRIGDYARYMGVSPDLLKHYEKFGLIQSEALENGYRYYAFQQSVPLLECMRLRNYGFSLREIGDVLNQSSFEKVQSQLDKRINEMEKHLQFEKLVVQEHRRISGWMDMMRQSDTVILEQQAEPMYFLPQSRHWDFIQDDRISQLLEPWVDAMPLVKSCRLLPDFPSAVTEKDSSWGLAVTASHARLLGLPMNDVVQQIPGGRYLHIHYHRVTSKSGHAIHHLEDIRELLREQQVQPAGLSVQVSLMNLNMDNDRELCGWFAIPLGTENEQQHG
ncbi:MAG: MerR family transcriptional regulator [Aristaeellaceae bacterium]